MKDYEEIIRQKGLPNLGQTVHSKKYGTIWRVMKKWEVWQNIEPDPKTGEPRMIPAIYLSFWRIQPGVPLGVGRMVGYTYTLYDNSFEANWEILPGDQPIQPTGWQEENKGEAVVRELPTTQPRSPVTSEKNEKDPDDHDQEGNLTKGKVINLRLTKKALYRAAEKEMKKIYQLSRGGRDPIIDETSREMFERGEIDEVRWKDWATYCAMVLNKLGNGFE
ncbi:MAG: hypothetical protein AB1491_01755 [Thermodesulfobacteriota bacterium]